MYPVLDYDTQEMKWRLAMRIFLSQRQVGKKAAKLNPSLSSGYKASRVVGGPRKRWEEFLKLENTEETKGNDLKNNDTWMRVAHNVAQDYGHDELKQICRKSPPHFSLNSFCARCMCSRFSNVGGFVVVQ